MSDLSALERETLAAIESASDESALEAARIAALGKKGSISALLAKHTAWAGVQAKWCAEYWTDAVEDGRAHFGHYYPNSPATGYVYTTPTTELETF